MTRQESEERIKKLRREINRHRYLYHVLNRQEISDAALDSLKHELALLEKQFPELVTPDSPTQRVAGKPLAGFKKVKHEVPMLSLNDAFSEKELEEWENRIKKLVPVPHDYFAEIKVDGFAVSLVYENGILQTGSTRGDGITGEDVTENLKTIESLPLRLENAASFSAEKEVKKILEEFPAVKKAVAEIPRTLEVRGEVYMAKAAFEEINRRRKKAELPLFANPRNIAAGSIRQLNPEIAASRKLDFLAYGLTTDLGQKTHEEEHLIARLFGFKTVALAKRCRNLAEIAEFWKTTAENRDKMPFLIDGIVVQVNSREIFAELGVAGKAPRGAAAFKFPAEEATSVIENIIAQVGRTGVLTPVAVLKPVEIGGVTVSRATLHNMDEIKRLDARIGDTAVVQRAGDVIPRIAKIIKNLRPAGVRPFKMPETFGGQPVVRRKGEAAYRILHPEKCEAARKEKLRHFVSKKAFDIAGLGPETAETLLNKGLIEDPADLFSLKEKDIARLERFAEKSAANLTRAVASAKEIELPRLIFALGIPHIGEETAIDLAKHFGGFKKLAAAGREELAAVPNIGPTTAESVRRWFRDESNREFLKKLSAAGVKIKTAASAAAATRKFSGKTFALTGTLETMTRGEAEKKIRRLGGKISGSVSGKTYCVVTGNEPGSKMKKAGLLGIKIIGEKEFLKLIKQ